MENINVLFAAYEAAPFYKRGGLGDVMESLPKALRGIGVDARVVMPYYDEIKKQYNFKKEGELRIKFDQKSYTVGVFRADSPLNRVPFYFLDNKNYLSLSRARDKTKRMEQFAFFDLAIVNLVDYLSKDIWKADIIHCNDWHTALIPLILKKMKMKIPTLLTIHNLLYQGVGSLKVLDMLDIQNDDETKILKRGMPINEMNVLGEGIVHATRVSTVSPSYAKEIMVDYDKNPISPFLKKREEEHRKTDGKIVGILNGIDYEVWSPAKDQYIVHKYGLSNWEIGKKDNKEALLKKLGLKDRPTFCFIGRMAKQKGLDIIVRSAEELKKLGINLIILGSGNTLIEKSIREAFGQEDQWARLEFLYSEELAHKLYAGSDFIIIPSHYEPCGLIQMVSMRYGTIPIASNTGGLADSINDKEDGFLFEKNSSRALVKGIKRALEVYNNKKQYIKMAEKAIRKDFSWDKSAVIYKQLYLDLLIGAS